MASWCHDGLLVPFGPLHPPSSHRDSHQGDETLAYKIRPRPRFWLIRFACFLILPCVEIHLPRAVYLDHVVPRIIVFFGGGKFFSYQNILFDPVPGQIIAILANLHEISNYSAHPSWISSSFAVSMLYRILMHFGKNVLWSFPFLSLSIPVSAVTPLVCILFDTSLAVTFSSLGPTPP